MESMMKMLNDFRFLKNRFKLWRNQTPNMEIVNAAEQFAYIRKQILWVNDCNSRQIYNYTLHQIAYEIDFSVGAEKAELFWGLVNRFGGRE